MSRFQLSLNVDDVEASVEFYSRLFGVAPAKHEPGYANFVVDDPPLKLVVIEGEGQPGTLNHLGIELASGGEVAAETDRVAAAGLPVHVDERHTCCYATQDKAWTRDRDGIPWELYTRVADTAHFGADPHADTHVDDLLPPVTREEVQSALDDPDTVVIDAQGDGMFEQAHLPGAIDFGLDDVVGQAAREINASDQRVILYCTDERCLGSEFVGTQLLEAGYGNVGRFAGGVAAWVEAGLPVEAGPGD